MIKVIIRDDDTCAFTSPDELENTYNSYLKENIPICLSVTPFRIPGGFGVFNKDMHWGIPEKLWGDFHPIPLENNKELVRWLKEKIAKNQIDIALHGYNHITLAEEYVFPHELAQVPQIVGREYLYGKNLYAKTKEGKEYLEKLLNIEIKTFVPPGNAISKEGIKAIAKNSLNLISVPNLYKFSSRPFSFYNYYNFLKRIKWYLIQKTKLYPFVLDFGNHKEIMFTTLGPDSDIKEIYQRIEFCDKVDGYFVLATHYHAFNKKIKSGETIRDAFDKIIIYLQKLNAKFIRYDKLWEK